MKGEQQKYVFIPATLTGTVVETPVSPLIVEENALNNKLAVKVLRWLIRMVTGLNLMGLMFIFLRQMELVKKHLMSRWKRVGRQAQKELVVFSPEAGVERIITGRPTHGLT